jgi:hypothetical protein
MGRACSTDGGEEGRSERKRSVGRHKHRWEDNINFDLIERKWGDMDWIHLAKDKDQ